MILIEFLWDSNSTLIANYLPSLSNFSGPMQDEQNDTDVDSQNQDENQYNAVTCLLPEHPQDQILVNDTKSTINKKTKIDSNVS